MRRVACWFVVGIVCFAGSSSARAVPANKPDTARLVTPAIVAEIREYLRSPIVTRSIAKANAQRAEFTSDDITTLDERWRAERQARVKPLITVALVNPLSSYLTRLQAHSLGRFAEIIVTDANGLNVGQSTITSDYWQGDEAKFQKTFPIAPNAVFLDDAEFHEATGTWRAQLNLTVSDESGRAIGAATFELNLTELERLMAVQQ